MPPLTACLKRCYPSRSSSSREVIVECEVYKKKSVGGAPTSKYHDAATGIQAAVMFSVGSRGQTYIVRSRQLGTLEISARDVS